MEAVMLNAYNKQEWLAGWANGARECARVRRSTIEGFLREDAADHAKLPFIASGRHPYVLGYIAALSVAVGF
jgi:hypothetical protein